MALIFKKQDEAFKEEITFEGYGVENYKVVLSDEDVALALYLFSKYKNKENKELSIKEQEELKFEEQQIRKLIWKDKVDYYLDNLGDYLFVKYTMAILIEVMGKQNKADQKFYTKIASKHSTKK